MPLLPEAYKGREQTYVKHIFLENYIVRVAYNILSFRDDFVFVDGFSGPWKSKDESLEDTSFGRATSKLIKIQRGLLEEGNAKIIRCLFIENNKHRFENLDAAVTSLDEIKARAIHGDFEDQIPEIVKYIGNSFSLVFIDPTGWKGFGLENIKPILSLKGEVIINFMFDHINRFMNHPRPETAETYDQLFGGKGWFSEFQALIDAGVEREEAVLTVYKTRLKKMGGYKYVTSTRIKHPSNNRTYFHLVYATRHPKGIIEFRDVEKKSSNIQEQVRDVLKQENIIKKRQQATGMDDLLGVVEQDGNNAAFEAERANRLAQAKERLCLVLQSNKMISAEELQGEILETPLIRKSDLNEWIHTLRELGIVKVENMSERAKALNRSHTLHIISPPKIDQF
ncbi:MAG: three-Cys-motif partner protein TcmP [Rhodospirillaceae bacterium]|nr:three-Cys-motif partner protein TcmP [Rhodospirillaceae bacterium]